MSNNQKSPASFSDFEFSYAPSASNNFPEPPPLPPSADLFSAQEQNQFYGFLDYLSWDLDNLEPSYPDGAKSNGRAPAPYSNPHTRTSPGPSASRPRTRQNTSSRDVAKQEEEEDEEQPQRSQQPQAKYQSRDVPQRQYSNDQPPQRKTRSAAIAANTSTLQSSRKKSEPPGTKPLLSSPQKRLNHIMSEQKRRNAIRDGYAQLIALLAPAGAPGICMPTRGRPKGSGGRSKGGSKGKSGVLFRAVEYIKWLEEGRDALLDEVLKVENAVSIKG